MGQLGGMRHQLSTSCPISGGARTCKALMCSAVIPSSTPRPQECRLEIPGKMEESQVTSLACLPRGGRATPLHSRIARVSRAWSRKGNVEDCWVYSEVMVVCELGSVSFPSYDIRHIWGTLCPRFLMTSTTRAWKRRNAEVLTRRTSGGQSIGEIDFCWYHCPYV
ncbi:hypothetical protein BC835DRAFT_561781 [Cytidiella melzeri]|nr:hypothetical protein BC835DRAFT_561781 [Cytidiella melzeri]